ncbi:MAG: hypothetical protein WCD57_14960 [Acidobacteriaceae bacterium]
MPENEDLSIEKLRRKEQRREQVLNRLWELAAMAPETTRGSITGQVKALQMIVAIEGLIPDRRAAASDKKSAPPRPPVDIYQSAWLRERKGETIDPQPDPTLAQEEDDPRPAEPEAAPPAPADPPPAPDRPIGPAYDRSQSVFAHLFHPAEGASSAPPAPPFGSAPDTRVPFFIQKNHFGRRR